MRPAFINFSNSTCKIVGQEVRTKFEAFETALLSTSKKVHMSNIGPSEILVTVWIIFSPRSSSSPPLNSSEHWVRTVFYAPMMVNTGRKQKVCFSSCTIVELLLKNIDWHVFSFSSQDCFSEYEVSFISEHWKQSLPLQTATQDREEKIVEFVLSWNESEKLTSSENSKARASTPQASNSQAASLCLCILCRGIFTTGTRCHLLAFAGGAVLSIDHAIKSAHTMELTSVCREWRKKIRGRTRLC